MSEYPTAAAAPGVEGHPERIKVAEKRLTELTGGKK